SKNGGAFAQKHQTSTPTHDENGWYLVALDTGDTDTLGQLTVQIHDSGALPVWRHFEVVPQPVYDAEVLGTDNLQVEAVAITDTGAIASAVWNAANRTVTNVTGFSDTGVNDRLTKILGDTDTGLRDAI